jgi:PAS domain S-box-containing protein
LYTVQPQKNNKEEISVAGRHFPADERGFQSLQQCYRYIIENAHEGIWMVDATGVTTYVNERIAIMLGTTVEKIKDKTTFDFFFEEDREEVSRVCARCSKRMKEELDFRMKKFDGTEMWAHITLAPITDKRDGFRGTVGMLTDITQKRKTEQALSYSEQQYRMFFNQELVGTVEVEPFTGKILAANKRLCEMLGYTEQELRKLSSFELTYGEDKQKSLNDYSRHSTAEIPFYTTEKRYLRKDGSLVWASVTIGMVKNNQGVPLHSSAIIVDITERKMLQEKLLREMEQRQKELTKAVIKGQEKERQLIGRELHDSVNQVLAVIKLYNEASLTADEAGREQFIHKSIKYLNECMNEVRKISKVLVVPNFDDIPSVDSVQELIASSVTNKLNISLHHTISGHKFEDEIQVAAYRIIQEHLSNILRHSEATDLKISMDVLDNQLTIEIADNGKGFNFKQKRKGFGISNMISRVEAVNGHIEFNTGEGKGCTLLVRF